MTEPIARIDWSAWNAAVAALALEAMSLVPDPLIRFDFLGEGWGCSIMWEQEGETYERMCPEAYGDGGEPLEALTEALAEIRGMIAGWSETL